MRRSKEIVVLFVLLIVAASFVLWYVIDRRAKNRAGTSFVAIHPPATPSQLGPVAAPAAVEPKPAPAESKPEITFKVPAPVAPTQPPKAETTTPQPTPVVPAVEFKPVEPQSILPAAEPASPPALTSTPTPPPAEATAPSPAPSVKNGVELGGENEGKTIDFTTGRPVTKDSEEDKAIIAAAVKDMTEAKKNIVFKAGQKPTEQTNEPAPAPKEK